MTAVSSLKTLILKRRQMVESPLNSMFWLYWAQVLSRCSPSPLAVRIDTGSWLWGFIRNVIGKYSILSPLAVRIDTGSWLWGFINNIKSKYSILSLLAVRIDTGSWLWEFIKNVVGNNYSIMSPLPIRIDTKSWL